MYRKFKSIWYFYNKYQEMVIFPKCKINIGLRITGKRSDGFHNIETIFYPVCFCDALEFVVAKEPVREDSLTITGLLTDSSPDDNLVIKAVRLMREGNKIPFLKIHLHKAIPAGAGLGGGSSDAANMLKALNRYFDLSFNTEDLREMALALGSDCSFFIESIPVFAEGRGEIMTPVKPVLEGMYLLLVNPGIQIRTREAYQECHPHKPETNLNNLFINKIEKWKELIINDFEVPIFKKYPKIKNIKDNLYEMGAVYSSISGSGSTVYGIFKRKPEISDNIRSLIVYSGVI
jgi:4-diphosphocytidyl-2-C-methyl-D-erythritol kinase